MSFFDEAETRPAEQREADLIRALSRAVDDAKRTPAMARPLRDIEAEDITSLAQLTSLPVTRKADIIEAQGKRPPFGGFTTRRTTEFDHIFQSPGPVYEPGRIESDWWRLGRFMHASDVGYDDIVHNCFSYHLTPAGMMFESGARAVGAVVLPAGTGQTDQQIRAAMDVGSTVYAGTPDYLKVLLDRAEELGVKLGMERAVISGGSLLPALRKHYAEYGIVARQCYTTSELGLVAYESEAIEGLIVDEGVILEIVRPGTGDPVEQGEIGEVLVTTLNPDYPLIRYATGDLSAVMAGESPCGRTNMRIRGWLGRVDQTSRIRGMFVRPEQVTGFLLKHPEISRARIIVERDGDNDVVNVLLEAEGGDPVHYEHAIHDAIRLKGNVKLVSKGSLPDDGRLIEDRRGIDPNNLGGT